jgi:Ca2+-binding RTX toxin-like protein
MSLAHSVVKSSEYDILTGGIGNGTFIFANGFGNGRNTDFTTGTARAHDTINWRGLGRVCRCPRRF